MTEHVNDPLAIWRAYCEKKEELENAQDRIAELEEELSIWKSVFPDVAPERVLPDRAKLEKHLLKVEMENEMLKIRLAALEAILQRIANLDTKWFPSKQHLLMEMIQEAKSAMALAELHREEKRLNLE